MKPAENTNEFRDQTALRNAPAHEMFSSRSASMKIQGEHHERLAVVYVRQSSPQQVLEHRESRERQYALAGFANALGWPSQRVLVIDEDQGQSGEQAEDRDGFQRLLTEVTMDHVGIVLGLEMSRLARSSKDWHQLFELCGIFGTLLADEDGVYDANDSNDRLLLGLKGIISEVELETMRNRLQRAALNKAKRGELFHAVPLGYVILPNGEVALDPDEQARSVMQLIFDKFDEIGSIYSLFRYLVRHGISLPIRPRGGPNKGELEWRRPTLITISDVLHHPIYAGAYTRGRRVYDRKCQRSGRRKHKQVWKPMDEWEVLIKDHLPAYITWERFLKNQERIAQNRSAPRTKGSPRNGVALLAGLLVCANCGRRMQVDYRHKHKPHYSCVRHLMEATEQQCWGLVAPVVDDLVSQQALKALEPAGVELSVKTLEDVKKERRRLDTHWSQRLQRARYDINLAERRYRAVDPDNRLVAATLEKQWEETLRNEREIQDEYDRFQQQSPTQLTDDERRKIAALSSDIPGLWNAAGTTNADRKEIIRCLIDQVVVNVCPDSEYVDATIHWQGGYTSQHEFIRPVATYAQLRDFEPLMNRVVELREAGHTATEIAERLNAEGFYPPKRRGQFTAPVIYQLLKRRGLIGNERSHDELLDRDEWWLTDLARGLKMSHLKLRDWAKRGWVHSRKTPVQDRWILWADEDEVVRLRKLLANSRRGVNAYTSELKTPKEHPKPDWPSLPMRESKGGDLPTKPKHRESG